jgi:hypothetical protein
VFDSLNVKEMFGFACSLIMNRKSFENVWIICDGISFPHEAFVLQIEDSFPVRNFLLLILAKEQIL